MSPQFVVGCSSPDDLSKMHTLSERSSAYTFGTTRRDNARRGRSGTASILDGIIPFLTLFLSSTTVLVLPSRAHSHKNHHSFIFIFQLKFISSSNDRDRAGIISLPLQTRKLVIIQMYDLPKVMMFERTLKFAAHNGEGIEIDENGDVTGHYDILNWQVGDNAEIAFVNFELMMKKNATIFWKTELAKLPHLTDVRHPGTRKGIHQGEPVCRFHCIPCADGQVSRQPGQRECEQCNEDYWSNAQKRMCVLKEVEFFAYDEALGDMVVIRSIFGVLRHMPLVNASDREPGFLIQLSLVIPQLSSMLFIGKPYNWSCVTCQVTWQWVFLFACLAFLERLFYCFKPTGFLILKPNLYPSTPIIGKSLLISCSIEFLCSMFGIDIFLALLCFLTTFVARLLPGNYYEGKCISFGMQVFFIIWISFVPACLSTEGKFKGAVEIFAILASSYGLLRCVFAPECFIVLLRATRTTDEIVGGRVSTIDKSIQLTSASVSSKLNNSTESTVVDD
ncbi:unnamed protein product [Nyctereutes procyonoides]|uniref:(raccoon dog) hypothetical protein n=1 Tax=Nyctereutes procyonoides TaxID=34880 RepID=A0A811Y9C8_NYCPR|nr:unnamed protein product [Nyctereutes procyonoides]